MKTLFKTALIIVAITSLVYAQEGQLRLSPSEINSLASVNAAAGTSGVSGIQTRTLKGDATKPSIYTIQLTIPANVTIQAHTHPDDRVATVISGTWYIGYGAKFDESKLKPLTAGSFYTEPPSVAHFAKTGNGKTPLVLIHGFGDDARMWLPLFADFGKDYTIIAPDLRGLGQSSREKGGYDKKTAAVDIHELVKSLGYKDIYLVGHDIGMMVAYAYAAQFPAEVKKLALLDAPIPGVGDVWEKIYTTPALWHFHFVNSPIALELVNGRERIFLEHVWQSFGGDVAKFGEEEKRMYAQGYSQPGVMRDAFEYFKAFEPTDAADNRNFARTKLPMPLLVIEGEKGMNGVLAVQAALISDHLKAIKFPSGHWLMEEKPAETSAALKDFFGN